MSVTRTAAGRAAALAVATALLAGCGGGGTGSVSGKVTNKTTGKPVISGNVMILGADGAAKYGDIGPDGSYRVEGVAAGMCKVSVSSPDPSAATVRGAPGAEAAPGRPVIHGGRETAGAKAKAAPPPGWFAIPDKYGDPNNSGLTVEVKRGDTSYNMELN